MEYPKIDTLFERDEKTHKVIPEKLRHPAIATINPWQWTEKIDGTNVRVIWQPAIPEQPESLSFNGRTNNAQMPADLIKRLCELVSVEKLRSVFPDVPAVIYGEGYGAGIQKGGAYSKTKEFAVFDVLVGGKWWLDWKNTCDVASKLGLSLVPELGEWSFADAVDFTRKGFPSLLGEHPPAEGIVGRTIEPLFDSRGKRLIVKLKTKDF